TPTPLIHFQRDIDVAPIFNNEASRWIRLILDGEQIELEPEYLRTSDAEVILTEPSVEQFNKLIKSSIVVVDLCGSKHRLSQKELEALKTYNRLSNDPGEPLPDGSSATKAKWEIDNSEDWLTRQFARDCRSTVKQFIVARENEEKLTQKLRLGRSLE